jgi:hypothetical protein
MSGRRHLVAGVAAAVASAIVALLLVAGATGSGQVAAGRTVSPADRRVGPGDHLVVSDGGVRSAATPRMRTGARPVLFAVLVGGLAATAVLVSSIDRRRTGEVASPLAGAHRPRGPPALA